MTEHKLVRIQEKDQVTPSSKVRQKLGLKKGHLVAIVETPEGALIAPQEVLAARALDRIGEALREQGLSLDEMIESGRRERAQIIKEKYGIGGESDENAP